MGATQSTCRTCTDESAKSKRNVVVMKEDGEPMKFKQGTKVKDVLDDYPFHKIVQCCSGRTVLAESFQLNGNRLYFLLPEGLAVNDTTYQSLVKAALLRGLIAPQAGSPAARYTVDGQPVECSGYKGIISSDYDEEIAKRNLSWKPNLLTIAETSSTSIQSDQSEKSKI